MKSTNTQVFPDIEAYSKESGLSPEVLEEAFKLENHYHKLLVAEEDAKKREGLYNEFYSNLLQFYGRTAKEDSSLEERIASKDPQVTLFEKELKGKSIIDFGCGEGYFWRLTFLAEISAFATKVHDSVNNKHSVFISKKQASGSSISTQK